MFATKITIIIMYYDMQTKNAPKNILENKNEKALFFSEFRNNFHCTHWITSF